MPRFVILEHDHPFLHWDLMLERGDVLRTWRLPVPPEVMSLQRGERLVVQSLPDHRPAYLDYEGPISGNRGRVVRRDQGTFEWRERREDRVVVELHGTILRGTLELQRSSDIAEAAWTLCYSHSATDGSCG